MDSDRARRGDPEPDLVTVNFNDGDFDVIPNLDGLIEFVGQN